MRTIFKYLLMITTLGWLCTFVALVNQFTAYQQISVTLKALREETALVDKQKKQKAPQIDRQGNTIYERTLQGVDFLEEKTTTTEDPQGYLSMEVMKSLSSTLIDLQNNVMEIQYFLSRRRDDWSQAEKGFMDDLVKYFWLQIHDSRELLVENHCPSKLQETSDEILDQINQIQNKRDCSDESNKVAVCDLQKACGFGCQLHHMTWCFILSFGLNRTMVLDDNNWSYSKHGWKELFQPISNCTFKYIKDQGPMPFITGKGEDPFLAKSRVIRIPIVDKFARNTPKVFLPKIPREWAKKMSHCHSNPVVWYASHFIHYNIRPNAKLKLHIDEQKARHNMSSKHFGVHVRRSDKITEAKYHDLWEYMEFVKSIRHKFNNTKHHVDNHVYLATDEPSVLDKETANFTEYKFFGDKMVARSAGMGPARYGEGNVIWVLTDLTFLAQSQYLVCTFSSQICRVAYEMMQFYRRTEDAGWRYQSLDDFYYFGGQGPRFWYATTDHQVLPGMKKQIPLKKGERLKVHGNHWDGFSKVSRLDKKPQEQGIVPSFKTRPSLPMFDLER